MTAKTWDTFAFTDIFTSRRARIPGLRPSSFRNPRIPTMTGTSGWTPSATRRTRPLAFWTTNKRIVSIVNNYAKISFNFGPTLLSWMEVHDPAVYGAIREADAESAKAFGGHGSAMAQPYNHMIMPLANERDKLTPGDLGNSRLRAPVWPPAGRDVAARNRRGPRDLGGSCWARHQVYHSCPQPGPPRKENGRPQLEGPRERFGRPHHGLPRCACPRARP